MDNITTSNYNASTRTKIAVVTGTTIATTACIASMMHKGNIKHVRNLEIGIKEGIDLCMASTMGGLIPGLLVDKKEHAKAKLHEASHQFIGNGLIPFSCLAVVNKLTEPLNKPIRALMAVGTLVASTFLGHSTTDKLLKTPNSYKVSLADFLPDVDDWVLAASTVLNSKALYKFTAMVCPFTYAIMGFRTGTRQSDNKTLDKYV